MEGRARLLHTFVNVYRRQIATTLRDGRDDDQVYALLAEVPSDCSTLPMDIKLQRLARDEVVARYYKSGASDLGVRCCLDQMTSLDGRGSQTMDVVVGLVFGDDIVSFITRLRPV